MWLLVLFMRMMVTVLFMVRVRMGVMLVLVLEVVVVERPRLSVLNVDTMSATVAVNNRSRLMMTHGMVGWLIMRLGVPVVFGMCQGSMIVVVVNLMRWRMVNGF